MKDLTLGLLPQPSDCTSHGHCTGGVQCVSTTSLDLPAVLASPDANSLPLHGILSAELTEVLAVLTDFHLLNLLTQTSTITGTIFPDNTNLLGSLGHC